MAIFIGETMEDWQTRHNKVTMGAKEKDKKGGGECREKYAIADTGHFENRISQALLWGISPACDMLELFFCFIWKLCVVKALGTLTTRHNERITVLSLCGTT